MSGFVPPATTSDLGAVKPDGVSVKVTIAGEISVPVATTAAPGLTKPDGTSIDVGTDGTVSVPLATTVNPGLMQPDGTTLYVDESGIENAVTATTDTLGIMKPDGATTHVDDTGVLSAANQGIELTDGTHDLHGVTKITTSGLAVSGTSPDASVTPTIATSAAVGTMRPDNTTTNVDSSGVLSAVNQGVGVTDGTHTVTATSIEFTDAAVSGSDPNAIVTPNTGSSSRPGILQVDGTTIHAVDGVISASLPPSGVEAAGDTGDVTGATKLTFAHAAVTGSAANAVVTPAKASNDQFGIVQVDGTSITATSGVISAAAGAGLPAGTQGDILRHGASVWGSLAAGTAGDVLTSDGADVSYQPARIAMAANSAAPTGTRNEIDIGNTDGYIAITATDDSAANTVHYSIDGSDALHAALGLGAVITILTDTTWVAKNLWNGSSTDAPPTGWQTAGFDDAAWTAAVPNPSGGIYPVPSDATPIWSENPITATGEGCLVRKRVVLPAGIITGATISSNADDLCHAISVNGVQVQSYAAPGARGVQTAALSPSLLVAGGSNIIAAWAEDAYGQPAMIAIRIDITYNAHSSAAKVTVAHDGVVVGTESEINFIAGSNVTLTVADDSVDGRVDVTIGASGGDGGAAVTHSTYLAANVTLTTAGVYYDIVSLSLEAGTWLLIGVLYIANPGSGGPGGAGAKLWDGTTVASASETTIPTAGYQSTLTLAAVVSPDSTTTYKISAVSQNNNAIVHADAEDFSNGNTASYLHAVRLGSGSGSGSTLTVEGGGGTVDTVTTLDFTSGATVSGTSPTANVAIADLTASGSGHHGGLAPDPGSTPGTSAYLREDAQWVIPSGQNLHGHIEVSGDVSVPSGTWTTVLSLTPSAGLWMFWGTVTIAGGASQPAFARIWDGTNDRGSAGGTLGASTGLTSYVCLSMSSDAIPLDGSTPVHLQAYVAAGSPDALALHNAGSIGLSALTHLRCIHVGD